MMHLHASDLDYIADLEQQLATETTRLQTNHARSAFQQCNEEKKAGEEDDTAGSICGELANCLAPLVPANAMQMQDLVRYLRERHEKNEGNGTSDVMLDLGSGDGRACVAPVKLGVLQRSIGIDLFPDCVKAARLLAFRQDVFQSCEFFQADATTSPRLLVDNPHLLSDKLSAANIIFIHSSPILLRRLVPLLARLTERNAVCQEQDSNGKSPSAIRNVEIVTLVHHIEDQFTVEGHVRDLEGTDLRLYDRIICFDTLSDVLPSPPPEPVDVEEIDRDFARHSIMFAMPQS